MLYHGLAIKGCEGLSRKTGRIITGRDDNYRSHVLIIIYDFKVKIKSDKFVSVLKSSMELFDVVFPQNIKPLTYRCPAQFIGKVKPGMLVSAPLKDKLTQGIVLNKSQASISEHIKYIHDVYGDAPIFEPPMLELLSWMSDYYLASKGIILRNMLPKEVFKKVRTRKSIKADMEKNKSLDLLEIQENTLERVKQNIDAGGYKTFLLHAPSFLYEISFLARILLTQNQSSIILVPEIMHVDSVAPILRDISGERLCIMHSGLSRGQRSEALEKIMSGKCDIVLGTRSAIFAPLRGVDLVAVLSEHSDSYRQEEGLRYNARDIGVMRGFLEKATVVLSSVCPTIESFYNVRVNKYEFISTDLNIQRPSVRMIDMRTERKACSGLSKAVIDAAQSCIKKNEQAMFVINKRGHSSLVCIECNCIEKCNACEVPLVFHANDKSLRCHYCGYKSETPDRCKRCGGFKLELIGKGIQKVEEDLNKIFGIKPVRLDSDVVKKKAGSDDLSEIIKGEALILGTKLMTKRLSLLGSFGMAAVLNIDVSLSMPDFRAIEKAYQELVSISGKVRPDGKLFIQTRMPENYLFRFLKNYDYTKFVNEELRIRKEMLYPPFSKIATVTLKGKGYNENKVKNAIQKISADKDEIEILGPSLSTGKKKYAEHCLFFRVSAKTRIQPYLREFLKEFEKDKDLKIGIAIDA